MAPSTAEPDVHVVAPPAALDAVELFLAGLSDSICAPTAADPLLRLDGAHTAGEVLNLDDPDRTCVATITITRVVGPGLVQAKVQPCRPFEHGPLRARRLTRQLPGQRLLSCHGLPSTAQLQDVDLDDIDLVVVTLTTAQVQHPDLPRGLIELEQQLHRPVRVVVGSTEQMEHREQILQRLSSQVVDLGAGQLDPHRSGGLVVLFTGLSGSGKSTLARAVAQSFAEDDPRRVTILDGDDVRQVLSSGLGFSPQDRALNVRRIGWVASLVAHHTGIALCSPIAPYDDGRQEIARMVQAAGGTFVLVHVCTPLAVCETRDRKGLYARARSGQIPDFTGISAPYEEPVAPDLRLDLTDNPISAAAATVRQTISRIETHI